MLNMILALVVLTGWMVLMVLSFNGELQGN